MNSVRAGPPYRSIFLTTDWAHQKYFGWEVVQELDGLRVLRKTRWPFKRYLLLLRKEGLAKLSSAMSALSTASPFSEIVIHDFDRVLSPSPETVLDGLKFEHASAAQRLLNVATFVVDLRQTTEALWAGLGSKSRNAVRRCEKDGVTVMLTADAQEAIDVFYAQSSEAIARYGLNYAEKSVLLQMISDGRLHALLARRPDGGILNVTLVYTAEDIGLYMYGSNAPHLPTGLGQMVQWEAIKFLKGQNLNWYDLGGVPSTSVDDPIFRFKESLGGTLTDLGIEYCYQASGLRALRGARRLQRSLIKRLRALRQRPSRGRVSPHVD